MIKLRCEPLSVPNEVVLSIIANKAKKDGVKVLISGEGADEFLQDTIGYIDGLKTLINFQLKNSVNYIVTIKLTLKT